MRRPRLILLLVLSTWMLVPTRSDPALPVAEVGLNLLHNGVQAVQAVLMVGNQILELTPLDELVLSQGIAEDLGFLMQLVSEAEGLAWDLETLERQFDRLFGWDTLPNTMTGYERWLDEVSQESLNARRYAMRTQVLIKTIFRTVSHLLDLMEHLSRVLGNLQVSSVASQAQQKLGQLLAEANTRAAAHERGEALQGAIDVAETQILRRVNCEVWKNWPGMTRCE